MSLERVSFVSVYLEKSHMKRACLAIALLLLGSATPVFAYTGYTGPISFLGTDWAGAGYIFALGGTTNPCPDNQFSMNAGAPGYKDQIATLMLAWALGEPVAVVTDPTDSCPNGRANIISVQIPTH